MQLEVNQAQHSQIEQKEKGKTFKNVLLSKLMLTFLLGDFLPKYYLLFGHFFLTLVSSWVIFLHLFLTQFGRTAADGTLDLLTMQPSPMLPF